MVALSFESWSKIARLVLIFGFVVFCGCVCSSPSTSRSKDSENNADVDADLPSEELSEVDCENERCLVVEESSEYCSVDGYMPKNNFFATKSKVTVKSGVYPLDTKNKTLPPIPVTITTPKGKTTLEPEKDNVGYKTKWSNQAERFSIEETPYLYSSDDLAVPKLILAASSIPVVWSDSHFRLGDPESVWWWYAAPRGVHVVLEQASDLFPKIEQETWIGYAPCELKGQPDDEFIFEFTTGEKMRLMVRSFTIRTGPGYYYGRLFEAKGSYAGQPVEVTDLDDLAFFGSGDASVTSMPGLVVRWDETKGSCGIIFEPYQVLEEGWKTWKAYRLTCDGEFGDEIPVKSVTHPPKYVNSIVRGEKWWLD